MNSYFLFNLSFAAYMVDLMLYFGWFFYRKENIIKSAKILLIISCVIQTAGIFIKTIEAGHAPFVNMYETLLFFIWVINIFYLVIDAKYNIKEVGVLVLAIIVLAMGFSKTLLSNPEPLVPALQSIWLEIHVITTFIGYAAFSLAYCVGLMYLIKKHEEDKISSNFNSFNISFVISVLATFIAGIILVFVEKNNEVLVYPKYNIANELISLKAFGFALSHVILFLFFISIFVLVYIICYRLKDSFSGKLIYLFAEINIAVVVSALVYYISKLIIRLSGLINTEIGLLTANTVIFSITFASIFLYLNFKRDKIEYLLPELTVLDSIAFISIAFGFPFLTGGIITGAIWADSAWGSYWGWDPKETWSLVTWFIYAAYLHSRYAKGWRDVKSIFLAIYGFIAVVFTYFGVNLFFAGLHSYA